MLFKIKEVANLVGISVRTLHHYDQIGLLKPKSTTTAGYRLYADHDLERLQQILFFKELGFNLQEIKEILDSPNFDRKQALQAQKDLLIKRKERLEAIIRLVEKTLTEGGSDMSKKDMFDAFDMSEIEAHQKKYAAQARQLYGKEMVEETEERTSKYSKNEWASIMSKWDSIINQLAAGMDKGPAHEHVQQLLDEFRQHITDNFYTCTLEIFRGLGDLYVNDQRFTANIDKYRSGLSKFLREAIHIYCDTNER